MQAALHVFELHKLEEETRRIEEEEKRRKAIAEAERKRVEDGRRAETQRLQDEARLQALKAKPIPKPSPPPAPPVQLPKPAEQPPPAVNGTTPAALNGFAALKSSIPSDQPAKSVFGQPSAATATSTATKPTTTLPPVQVERQSSAPNPFQQPVSSKPPAQPQAQPPAQPQAKPQPQVQVQAQVQAAAAPQSAPTGPPVVDRYVEIHRKLKEFRAHMAEAAKTNPALKTMMGEMRREIRKSIGQLTSGGLKENKIPVSIR